MAAEHRRHVEERRRVAERRRIEHEDFLPDEGPAFDREENEEEDEDQDVGSLQSLLQDRRRIVTGLVLIVLIVVAIYVLFPKIVGADEAVQNLGNAVWYWIVIAVGFNVLAFAAYVALFRGVLGGTRDDEIHRRLDMRASYLITMAGLAATRIFSAAGAGGIVLTYWALRKAGMPRRRSACRMVAFLTLTYGVYLCALVIFGILLRTHVLPGNAPFGGTVVPAALAAGVMAVFLLIALIPQDFERPTYSGWPRARPRSPAACAPRSPTFVTRAAARWPCWGRWASGRPTSASCGPASRRSAATFPSPCWSRASSWGWRPT
jgi:succinate dehydrogenase hydrophobic anchor subunit